MDIWQHYTNLHQIPELAYHEVKTQEYILNTLSLYRCRIEKLFTGVIAYFDFNSNHTIGFRAEMDGLEIEEVNQVPFKSKIKGQMHACGHDANMACLLKLAEMLNETPYLKYNVVCLFQPAEEEDSGAKRIIVTGELNKYHIDLLFGIHFWPNLKEGRLYSKMGAMLAGSSEVDVIIHGKTNHMVNYKEGHDALASACEFIHKIYVYEDSKKEALLRCNKMISGNARNVISNYSRLWLSLRSFSDESRDQVLDNMLKESQIIEKEYKVSFEMEIKNNYHIVYNDKNLYSKLEETLHLNQLETPFMQADDFGNYGVLYPCLYILVGLGNEIKLHTSTFLIQEQVLNEGYNALKNIALCKNLF